MEAELEVLKFKNSLPMTNRPSDCRLRSARSCNIRLLQYDQQGPGTACWVKDKLVSLVHSTDLFRELCLPAKAIDRRDKRILGSDRAYTWREIGDTTKQVMGKNAFRVRLPEPLVYAVAKCRQDFSPPSVKNRRS